MDPWYNFPNRTICSVLEEMREALRQKYTKPEYLLGLVCEIQTLANRMESALEDWHDVRVYTEKRRELRIEVKELEAKKKKLEPKDES